MTPSERPTSVRYLVLLALGLAAASAYLTRGWSAANTTIASEFQFDAEKMGYIVGSFYLAYAWCQIPAGWLANRFGCRVVLPAMSVLWSLCAAWTSFATSDLDLYASRIGLGIAQAGLVPCCGMVLGDWFPTRRRGMASAVVGASMQVGGLLASGLTAALLPRFGWRNTLLLYSTVGSLWGVGFYAWFRNRPAEHPHTNAAEQALIRGEALPRAELGGTLEPAPASPARAAEVLSTGELLVAMITSGGLWAVCGQQFCRAFGYEFFTTWFPAFLETGRGMQVAKSGIWGMLPLSGVLLGSLCGGWLIDLLLVRTGSKRLSRSGTAVVSLGLCAILTLTATWAPTPEAAVVIISLGMFLFALAGTAAWGALLDMSGHRTALFFGVMNMAGNLGAWACPVIVGVLFKWIKQTGGDWNLILYLIGGVYFGGAACWMLLDPNRPIVDRARLSRSSSIQEENADAV